MPDDDLVPSDPAGLGPYRIDVTITLYTGGTVRIMGANLDTAGLRATLDLIRLAVPDVGV